MGQIAHLTAGFDHKARSSATSLSSMSDALFYLPEELSPSEPSATETLSNIEFLKSLINNP